MTMRRKLAFTTMLGLVALAVGAAEKTLPKPPVKPAPGAAAGQDAAASVSGAYDYRVHCASCHGAEGKGDGPMVDNLRFHPPDLSLLSRRAGGSYPADRVQRVVDGRVPLKGHGGTDMPIWGDAFKNAETGYDEGSVRRRIQGVVEYLRTLQK
jgi:mono/diheme cytochrome c family protein